MTHRVWQAAAAAFVIAGSFALQADPAPAFFDLFDRGQECGEPQSPKVIYRDVRRRVVYAPGYYVLGRRPGLYGWRKMRVVLPSGHVEWRKKRVLVRSYRNLNKHTRARYRWVRERQRIVVAAPPRPEAAWPSGCW